MRKGERTRETILDHAVGLASKVGLEGLSIGALAADLGLSKSGLFAHFGSKEALQLRVLERAVDRFIDTVVAPALRAPRGEPRLRALFENWLTWSRAEFLEGGCPLVAAAVELDDRPGPVRDYLLQAQKDWLGALATAARIAIEEGHFSPDTEPEQVAHEFNSAILGYHHAARLLRDPQAEARTRRAFEALVARAGAAPAQP